MTIHTTACPRNCYSTCTFKVHVEGEHVVNIDPHPGNRATPEGICIKGLSYVERAHSPKRILHPLRKKGNGDFERISWDVALEEIASRLIKYKEESGSYSILFYTASGMAGLANGYSSKFWELFGGATTMYGNLCWPAGLEAVRLTLGDNKHSDPWDIQNARLIILWGKNPAETNIQQMIFIEKALEKKAKLVVVDPRRTQTSERADLLIQPLPGTDAALALAIAREMVENGWTDEAFLQNHVLGYEAYQQSIEAMTLKRAVEITHVPEDMIREMARMIGQIKPMTLAPGYGMQRFTNGGQTIRALLALNVLSGNIGKPGACFHYANLQSYVFDAVKEPMSYYPEIDPNPLFRRKVSMAKLGQDMLDMKDPQLRMIWVERGNPVTQNPDTNTILKAFRKLEFRVVVEQFMTDTAREADIVLPAKNMFEQTDIIGSYWNPYVQLKPKVLEPAGEVKPETEIYWHLAEKLGYREDQIAAYLPLPGDENIVKELKKKVLAFPELDFERLKDAPAMAPGNESVAFADLKFNTPSGKIELVSETAHKKWNVNRLPTYEPLIKEETRNKEKFPFQLLSPNTKNRIHSQFGNLEVIRQFAPEAYAVMSVHDTRPRGIREGDSIRIFNERGEFQTRVKVNFSLKPGCIVYYNGWWLQEGGTPNLLSKGRETDMGYGTAFHDCLVQVYKVNT